MSHDSSRVRALADALPALVFIADSKGANIATNLRLQNYTGRPPEALLGHRWLDVLHVEDRDRARAVWHRAVERGVPYEAEYRLLRHDGDYRWHLCRAEPWRGASMNVREWFGSCIDIEERKRMELALYEQNQRLTGLLETLPVGVMFAHDSECRHITSNPAAAKLLRMPTDANVSKSADTAGLLPFRIYKGGLEIPADALPMQRAAKGEYVHDESLVLRFSDGTSVEALISARPMFGPGGELTGAIATMLDVTDLKRAEHELRDTDRRKDEFLAVLSHELRNPLAPIRSALDVMQLPRATPEMITRSREMMQRQVSNLVRLVDDLLDMSRINRRQMALKRSTIDLNDVIEAAVETVSPLIAERRHELDVELALQPAALDGDLQRLTQAVSNLLTNAARYTEPGGKITIRTVVARDTARVHVRDTGIGIAGEHLQEVFRMFARVGARHRSGHGGLGIGLSLAHEIVALHGGAITANSDGVGRGSEFVIELPLVATHAPATRVPRVTQRSSRGVGRRVLIVDDNRDAAEAISLLLTLEKHVVAAVHDGRAAIEAVKTFGPEVVLLDIGLPGMNGYEVARWIREMPDARDVLLVAITGFGQEDDQRDALDAGFDLHLTKPVDLDALHRVLAAFDHRFWVRGRAV